MRLSSSVESLIGSKFLAFGPYSLVDDQLRSIQILGIESQMAG